MSGATTLGGRGLLVARVAWVAVAALTVAVLVASAPILFERFSSVCLDAARACAERSEIPAASLGTLRAAGISLGAYAAVTVGVEIFCKLVWLSVGALVFVYRSHDRMALLVSFFLVTFGTATLLTNGTEALAAAHPAWWVVARGLQVLGEVSVVLFLLTFPDGRFVPRWSPIIAVTFLVFQIPEDLVPGFYASGPAFLDTAQLIVFLGTVPAMVGLQVYRYRHVSGAEQRRQTRWAVFGTALAILMLLSIFGTLFFLLPGAPEGSPLVLILTASLIPLVMLLIPLSIGVAVFRSGLFDIDLVINRALVYGTLTASLVLVYFGAVVTLQGLLSPLVGEGNQLVVVASTLLIAALFSPFRRRIQATIDRRFYRSKYDAQRTLEAFSASLRDEVDLEQLNANLVATVRETVQPAHAFVWLKPIGGRRTNR
jgi:hypothetical protein